MDFQKSKKKYILIPPTPKLSGPWYERRFGLIKLVKLRHSLLKCLYQTRKVGGRLVVCWGCRLWLFLRFFYWILKLFRQCGICFFFIFSYSNISIERSLGCCWAIPFIVIDKRYIRAYLSRCCLVHILIKKWFVEAICIYCFYHG